MSYFFFFCWPGANCFADWLPDAFLAWPGGTLFALFELLFLGTTTIAVCLEHDDVISATITSDRIKNLLVVFIIGVLQYLLQYTRPEAGTYPQSNGNFF
jgi:hypothetical protein